MLAKLNSPFFSIITVSLDSGPKLYRTIESVLSQKNTNWELIIKLFKESKYIEISKHDLHKITYVYSWDSGIYDAMNQALPHIKGQYTYFLNAGDQFANSDVLSNVEKELYFNDYPDMAWGNILNVSSNTILQTPKPDSITRFYLFRNGINHQAQFIKASALIEMGEFDIKLKCAADHDLLTKALLLKKYKAIHLNHTVAAYEGNGYSSSLVGVSQMRHDYAIIRKRYLKLSELIIYNILYALTFPKLRYWFVNSHFNKQTKNIYRYIANRINQ